MQGSKIVSRSAGVKEGKMAVIVKHARDSRVEQSGTRGLRESLIAGPSAGCNRFTMKKITLEENGRTANSFFSRSTVYFIHQGTVALCHDEGGLDHLKTGEAAVVHPDEEHFLKNLSKEKCIILAVTAQ